MAIEPMGLRAVGPRSAVDEREFPVVRDGFDRQAVKRYLADIDAYVGELESWIQRLNTRLVVAEERVTDQSKLDAAAIAIFETRDRLLDDAKVRAERIEAEAAVRARQSQEETVARILDEARAKANRIIQTALDGVEHARNRVPGPAPAAPAVSPEPVSKSHEEVMPDVFRLSGDPDVDWHEPLQPVDEDDRRSRYERTSANLPSLGADASKVYGTLHRLRGEDR